MSARVLALLLDPAGAAGCLDAVAGACRALPGARVSGLHVRADPAGAIMPTEEVLTAERQAAMAAEAARGAAAIRSAWESWPHPELRADWREEAGDPASLARAAGAFALVAMTLPRHDGLPAHRAALDALLFTEGQPVLVVPAGWTGGFGRHLAAGWRDTAGTRRALASARPWLEAAERVTLLAVTADDPAWPGDAPGSLEAGSGEKSARRGGRRAIRCLRRWRRPVLMV